MRTWTASVKYADKDENGDQYTPAVDGTQVPRRIQALGVRIGVMPLPSSSEQKG